MNPTSNAATPPLPLRFFRALLIMALTLAWMVIAGLFYAGRAFSAVGTHFPEANRPPDAVLFTLGIIVMLLPLALAFWAARRRWLRWPVLAATGLATGVVLAWLAWDDPIVRRPLTNEDIAPAFDGAERSYAVLMEYGKQHPSEESQAFTARKHVVFTAGSAAQTDKWISFITKYRATLDAEWAAAAPQRAWLDRLNAFDRLGDLTPADFAADIPRFDVWRFLAQRSCALASLQALDGHGDEAVATLLPMLEVARKLEPSSRTLVRLMIARVAQKMCYETASFILDRAAPSPAARARLRAAIESGNGPAGARRIMLIEYTMFMPALAQISLSDALSGLNLSRTGPWPRALNLVTCILFNPRATTNLYGDYAYALATLAEVRDLDGLAAREQAYAQSFHRDGGMKNLGGRLLVGRATPAYEKIVKTYWDIEDLRAGLCVRLKPPP